MERAIDRAWFAVGWVFGATVVGAVIAATGANALRKWAAG